jgi:hypothetical protein
VQRGTPFNKGRGTGDERRETGDGGGMQNVECTESRLPNRGAAGGTRETGDGRRGTMPRTSAHTEFRVQTGLLLDEGTGNNQELG